MDQYALAHELETHTWRTRTMVVSTIAAVELVALIALGIVLLGKGWFQHERATRVAQANHEAAAAATKTDARKTRPVVTHVPAPPAKPLLARARTSVLVLNGNGRDGAAGAEATVLRQHDYPVTAVGNAKRNDYAASIVMYRPGYDREARRLARDLRVPMVSALDGVLTSQLKGARLLLIIGK
jgi:LytR cell envelope-related transcriptional attenuator